MTASSQPTSGEPRSHPYLLLVDDTPENLRVLGALLTEHGHRVRSVTSGAMALTVARARTPALILLDINLPDRDGYAVCRELKSDPTTREVPVIFISARDDPVDKVRAFEVGGVDYVTKPFQVEEVCARIDTHLTLQRLHDELADHSRALETLVARRTEEIRRSEQRRRVLLEINNALINQLTCASLFEATTEALKGILAFERASLVLLEGEGKGRVAAATGVPAAVGAAPVYELVELRSPMPARDGTALCVVKHDLAVEADGSVDARLLAAGIRSYMSVPLVAKRGPLGLLHVASVEPGRYGDADTELILEIGQQLALAVENMLAFEALEATRSRLEHVNAYLEEEVSDSRAFGDIIGTSTALKRVLRQVEQVAPTDAAVLILGESGTGKELIAHAIHSRSRRAAGPLIRVNCAAVPRELFESEFFGHVKGAFTGALRPRVGRFELADGGTLFLDEVGEIPLELQSKLLRVLQEGEYERLGEGRTRRTDVRIVAATNRDLAAEVAAGQFREDLFYRLVVFPIQVAPLRERPSDVPLLARHFLARSAARMGLSLPAVSDAQLAALAGYEWPGNVRELQNVIERAIITMRGERLAFEVGRGGVSPPAFPDEGAADRAMPAIRSDAEMQASVRANMEAALQACGGQIYGPDGAAARLDMKPTTLSNRVRRLGLARPEE